MCDRFPYGWLARLLRHRMAILGGANGGARSSQSSRRRPVLSASFTPRGTGRRIHRRALHDTGRRVKPSQGWVRRGRPKEAAKAERAIAEFSALAERLAARARIGRTR